MLSFGALHWISDWVECMIIPPPFRRLQTIAPSYVTEPKKKSADVPPGNVGAFHSAKDVHGYSIMYISPLPLGFPTGR
jgi:hypothetical protein